MSNLEKLNKIFAEVFQVETSSLNDNFNTDNVDKWDSVVQLSLVSQIEDEFDIMFDTEEIFEFTSYGYAKIALEKHGIEIS